MLIASDPRIEHDRAVRDVPVTTFPDPATLVDLGDAAAFRAELAKMTPEERMAASRDRFFRQAEAVTPVLVEIVGKFRPDVIYREQTFSAGSLAAAVHRCSGRHFRLHRRTNCDLRPFSRGAAHGRRACGSWFVGQMANDLRNAAELDRRCSSGADIALRATV